MHGSAYNLLFESHSYKDIDWDKQELVKQLRTDTQKCCPQTWVMDDTK